MKKIIAALLAALMIISCAPLCALADDDPVSIDFSFNETVAAGVRENTGGEFNETLGYYVYTVPTAYAYGNTITLHYQNGSSKTYTACKAPLPGGGTTDAFLDENGKFLPMSVKLEDPQSSTAFTVGDNPITVRYGGDAYGNGAIVTTAYFKVLPAPTGLTLHIDENPIVLVEHTTGYWLNDAKGQLFYEYHADLGDYYFTLSYDGEPDETVTPVYESTDFSTWVSGYVSDRGRSFSSFDFSFTCGAGQYEEHWTVGTYHITAEYQGLTDGYDVIIVPSEVESITLEPEEPLEIEEKTHGKYYGEQFSYFTSDFVYAEGNKLTVNYKNNDTAVFTCGKDAHGNMVYTDSVGNVLEGKIEIVDPYDYAYWKPGKHTITVSYMGATAGIDVKINEKPPYVEPKNGWYDEDGNRYYYIDDVCQTGLFEVGGNKYFANESGAVQRGPQEIDGNKYFFGDDYSMQTGWVKIDGNWFYFKADGTMATGWVKDSTWYYLKADGVMATGWLKDGGTWYFLKPNGAMATGWLKDGGTWYFLNPNGAMATGWRLDGGKWYYLRANGSMATGWAKVSGTWYYFEKNGAMKTGWLKDGGYWYYLEANGAMLASTSKKINGKTYKFNSSGVCTNP